MLRTLLYWAVVLLTSMSYPARPGIWFYVFGGWDGVSEMLLLWELGVVILRSVVRFRLSVNVSDARASHFASLGGCFAHFYVIPGLTGYLVLCLWWVVWMVYLKYCCCGGLWWWY